MTLIMQDSITVANLTADADAYLGYVGGRFNTWAALQARFPRARLLPTAIAADEDAECCDREPGDLAASEIAGWVKRQMARGVHRPVVYASASNMPACLVALAVAGIGRADVRLLSAHYGWRGADGKQDPKHICGPATCRYPGVPACDGTQWTDQAPGANGSKIDESILNDDFFEEAAMPLSTADIQAVAKATAQLVWTVDGVIPAVVPNKANPFWEPQRVMSYLAATATVTSPLISGLAKDAGISAGAIVTGVLAGLDPASLADAIATSLGPEIGQQVVDALSARLAAPAPS
jgi:hypothetical protein